MEAAHFLGPERPVCIHRHIYKVAVLQKNLIGSRAASLGFQRIVAIVEIGQVLVMVPELGQIQRPGRTGGTQQLRIVGTLLQQTAAAVFFIHSKHILFHRRDEQVQHSRLFNRIARIIVAIIALQTVVCQIEVCDRDRDVRERYAVGRYELVVVRQGKQNRRRTEILTVVICILLHNADINRSFGNAVLEDKRLLTNKLRVKRGELLYLAQRRMHNDVVASIRRKLDARQVKLLARLIGFFVAAGDFELVENRFSALHRTVCSLCPVLPAGIRSVQQRYNRSVFELVCRFHGGQLVRVRAERIICTVLVQLTDAPRLRQIACT